MNLATSKDELTTVLIIDDVPMNIRHYSKLLQPLNVNVLIANSFFEACLILQQKMPKLILFNHETVLEEHKSFLTLFKDNPELAHIPLIAIIRDYDEEVKRQVLDSGCDHYIVHRDVAKGQLLYNTIDKAIRCL